MTTFNFIVASSLRAAGVFWAGGAILGAPAAWAEPIAIENAGFEADFANPNSFPVLAPQGWTRFDPGNIIDFSSDALGVLNPSQSTFFPGGAPEGRNVALVYLAGDVGTTPAGLSQVLPASLRAGLTYTLRVEVGNIASGFGAPPFNVFFDLDGFPGYAVQLLAGGSVVAEDHNTLGGSIPEGTFATSTVSLRVGPGHPRLGQALEVRLINLNVPGTPGSPGIEVDFDRVRLEATACRPDFNLDGAVDPDDLSDFIACYFATPACAGSDFNGDGGVDPDDLSDFIAAFFQGC